MSESVVQTSNSPGGSYQSPSSSVRPHPSELTATPAQTELMRAQRTILVVEDEPNMASLFKDVLELHNYHVVEAQCGATALEVYAKQPQIDLVIIDIILPKGFSGLDLADFILQKNPDQKLMFTSGCTPSLLRSRVRLQEGRNFLPKPFSPTGLLAMVATQLQN